MSGRCDTCGEVGDVWCGLCLGPHPDDAHRRLRQSEGQLAAANATIAAQSLALATMREALVEDGECVLCDGIPGKHETACLLALPADDAAALAGAVLAAGELLAAVGKLVELNQARHAQDCHWLLYCGDLCTCGLGAVRSAYWRLCGDRTTASGEAGPA